jgi:hypothetical protein
MRSGGFSIGLTQAHIEVFWYTLWSWILELLEAPNEGFSLGLDSRVFSREGGQEGAAKGYNFCRCWWRYLFFCTVIAVGKNRGVRCVVEQRIAEMNNDLNADGFCTKKFFATEAVFLGGVLSFNLLYQAGVTRESEYRKPSTLRTAVCVGGAIL